MVGPSDTLNPPSSGHAKGRSAPFGPPLTSNVSLDESTKNMMAMSENKRILQHVFVETGMGNGRPFLAALSENVVWTIIGSTRWSKTYTGKQAVLRELLGPLNAQLANRNTITAHRFTAEGDLVVVEGRGQNTTKAGKQYNNRYCWVFRFSEGEVVELIEYTDTALIDSALQPPVMPGASQTEQ